MFTPAEKRSRMPRVKIAIPERLGAVLLKPKQFKIIVGGRGGAKSRSVGQGLIRCATQRERIVCFREFQNSIEESVHSLLASQIKRLAVPGFSIQDKKIVHSSGGLFKFKGLARNIYSIKSFEGFLKAWCEEAQSLSEESIEILTPTIREPNSEIWFTANLKSAADAFSQRFINHVYEELLDTRYFEDDQHIIIWINYDENPWFPETLESQRLLDYERLPRTQYNHKWLGYFDDSVPGSIIPTEWFEAAINAHEKLGFEVRGVKVASHDPSDEGFDPKALAIRHGSLLEDVELLETLDVNEGCSWAIRRAIDENADLFTWDADGMGVSLKAQVRQSLKGKKIDYVMFKGSNAPDDANAIYQPEAVAEEEAVTDQDKKKNKTNRQTFKNKRAQYYWRLRDRFYNTWLAVEKNKYIDPDVLISISPNIKRLQQLKSEICRIPIKPNTSGLIQIMSKEEMKRKHKIDSPNMADVAMMSLIKPDPLAKDVKLNFKTPWN
jgi:phage terminase large subunit